MILRNASLLEDHGTPGDAVITGASLSALEQSVEDSKPTTAWQSQVLGMIPYAIKTDNQVAGRSEAFLYPTHI